MSTPPPAPPSLCPYCGHDLAPARPAEAPCPHCGRAPVAAHWNLLPAVRGTRDGDVRIALDTTAAIFLLCAVLLGAVGWFGPGRPPPPGLILLLLATGIVITAVRITLRRSRRNAEWTFRTDDGWSGMARFRAGALSYAEGSWVIAHDPVPCAPPPPSAAVLTWDALRACDDATLVSLARDLPPAQDDADVARSWVPEFGTVVGLAARGRIGLRAKKVQVEGWTRAGTEAAAPREPMEFVSARVVDRDGDGASEPAYERAFLAALRAELSVAGDEAVGGYRDAAPRPDASLAAVRYRTRTSVVPEAPTPTGTPADVEALRAAWRAFVEGDPFTVQALWGAFTEADDDWR